MEVSVEILPYLISVVVAFAVWALLYSPMVFENAWKKAGNLSDAAMQKWMSTKLWVALVLRAVQMYVLIHMITYMTRVDSLDAPTLFVAARTAFWMWFWFSMIAHLQENLWKEDINWTLFAINAFGTLCMLVAGGVAYVWLSWIL